VKEPDVAEGVVASFLKNDRELVVGELNLWKGKRYAHVRVLVPSAVDEEWIHTDNGVAIEADRVGELKTAVDKLLDVASRDVVVGRIPIGNDEIRVGVNTFKGNAYAYLRRFYTKADEWRPTRKGVSVRVEMAGDLVDLVGELAAAARSETQ
jgi:hypothetical protein